MLTKEINKVRTGTYLTATNVVKSLLNILDRFWAGCDSDVSRESSTEGLSLQEVPPSSEGEISEFLLPADCGPLQVLFLHVWRPHLPALPAEHVPFPALARAAGPGLQTHSSRLQIRDIIDNLYFVK